jgi:NADH-quinone oxidoreductase subunit J
MLIALVLLAEILLGVGIWNAGPIELAQRAAPMSADVHNIEAIGALLYTRYIFLFEAAGIVLLVAMIGAIVLTHRARSGVRGQNIDRQNRRRPDEAVVNVNQPVGQGVEL